MTVIGTVRNGKIELPAGVSLPDGTEVSVQVLARPIETPANTEAVQPAESFHQQLMKFAGIVKGMPEDYSINHDHYLYGAPKSS